MFIQIFVVGSERRTFLNHSGPSRSSKVVDFGTNQKHVCHFLFVINNNLGPILPRFRDIAGFLRRATPPLFHPNFRGVPFGLDWRCCAPRSKDPALITGIINFELIQSIRPWYVNVTDGRTDGRLMIAIPRFALPASRANKH